uniref:DUF4283 domain-containing protein n=1 Tax=Nelumbo nucifera TaxID=4432 RepID=A0A822XXV5_NELNU|nr:TPA_asm: hypothetical protein HUJ06_025299 [Nelumbo nucifera]
MGAYEHENRSKIAQAININELKGKKDLESKWALCLFSKFLGEEEPLKVVIEKAQDWKLESKTDIRTIGNDFFLFSFTSKADYKEILTKGPWIINGKYFIFVQWKVGFNPLREKARG